MERGRVVKVVEFASDITSQKQRNANYEGQIAAINRVMAVVEFDLSGTILRANDNFLNVLGYAEDEIKGRHHRMFVEPSYANSDEYRQFWERLERGEFETGQYKRLGKGGKEIWIQASYNPVLNADGRPVHVIKFASDITATVEANRRLQAAAMAVIDAAEQNDLTKRISLEGQSGDIAMLCAGMNKMLDSMSSVVREIREVAREVSNASAEISASTSDLSQRTEEQAASLEETSASMEEIAATVKKNAENAQAANQAATATHDVASRGGQVVAQAVEAMSRIEDSSRSISDIIGVIDEIARQTNLLALNAAVEAARAGDAGRGFAVVASEVRSLAQRSSQAAKDIKDLIVNSSSQVKGGVELVNRAGAALNEITESIKQVADLVSDIASASMEQATGIEQVNKALTQMDEATQQNSALVEENAATAKTLEHQAKAMDERIAVFRIDEQAGGYRMAAGGDFVPAQPPRAADAAKRPAVKAGLKPKANPVGRMHTAIADAWKDF
jgi:methyl-accepting chemotaxis protein